MHIRDVAKKLNVSVATVSRALNPATEKLVTPKTRQLVKAFAMKAGFVPNRAARGLSRGRTNTIGVVLPTNFQSIFFNDHFSKVLSGLYKTMAEKTHFDCKLIVMPRGVPIEKMEDLMMDSGVDGLVLSALCDHRFSSSHLFLEGLFKRWKKPIVVVGLKTKSSRFNCVYSDNAEATKRALTHLIQKGHERIGIIRGWVPGPPDIEERFEAFKRTLKDHRLEIREEWNHEGRPLTKEEDRYEPAVPAVGINVTGVEYGYNSVLDIFKRSGSKPTALFCVNDEMAIGAVKALRTLKIRCPQEVAVMGFDGLQVGELLDLRLTTVNQPTVQMAETGTRLLLDILEDKVKTPQALFIPMDLIIRDSA